MADERPDPNKPEQPKAEDITQAYKNLLRLEDSFSALKHDMQRVKENQAAAEKDEQEDLVVKSVCRDNSEKDFVDRVEWGKVGLGIRRKLWLVMSCGLIAAGLGAFGSFLMTRDHEATTVVLFTELQDVEDPQGVTATRFNVQTVAEMIKSPNSLERVREMLGLNMEATELGDMVDVASNRTSNLIKITAAAINPDLAIDIANTLAQVSVNDSMERYKEHAQRAFDYYDQEEQDARQRLEEYSSAITRFKQQAKVLEMDLENSKATESISEVEREYRQASIEYEELLVEYENLQREIDKLPDHVVRYEYDDNPLKARISHKEMSLLEARTKYGPENPKVLLLEEEIRQLRMALSDSSFDETREQIYEKNFTKEQLNIEKLRLQGRLRAAQKKKQTIQASLATLDEKYEEVPQEQLEYAALLRRANLASEEVSKLAEVKREAKTRMERDTSDLAVRESALEAERRSTFITRTLPTISFLLGSFVGLFFVMISEITDGKVLTPAQIRKLYRIPHLLSIPRISALNTDSEEKLLFYIRTLSERLSQLMHDRPFHSVVFTSAKSKEGRTMLAFHLARYYKRLGIRTAYVDFGHADNRFVDMSRSKPINDYILGQAKWNDILVAGPVDSFKAAEGDNMKEIMKSKQMREFWEKLRESYELIVVDAPGVIDEHYAVNVAIRGDLCLYVVGADRVDQSHIDSSLQELEKSGTRVKGLILNQISDSYIDDPLIAEHSKKQRWGAPLRS